MPHANYSDALASLQAVDLNTDDVHTFSIVGGRDASHFRIGAPVVGDRYQLMPSHNNLVGDGLQVIIRTTDSANSTFDKLFIFYESMHQFCFLLDHVL